MDLSRYLVGSCEVTASLRRLLSTLAASDATVLVRGESGTGKAVAARALHEAGPRATGPLVTVHLEALAPSLVEAELFGHEEGAYTGAHRSRLGRVRQAQGGTLVLDDVDSLPAEVQGKLVRVLQTRVVEPVGAEEGVPVDVRVVATTRADLRSEVEAGRFRSDLYYRLAVVPVELPPLRARLEDLPELALHLIGKLAAERGLAPRELGEAALERLWAHPWPGNVRELENALERALVLAAPAGGEGPAPQLTPGDFAFLESAGGDVADDLCERALAHGVGLAELERALLRAALRQQRGNLSAAARQVGLSRRAFEYRLGRAARSEAKR